MTYFLYFFLLFFVNLALNNISPSYGMIMKLCTHLENVSKNICVKFQVITISIWEDMNNYARDTNLENSQNDQKWSYLGMPGEIYWCWL